MRIQLVTYCTNDPQLEALIAYCEANGIDYEAPEDVEDEE